MRLICKITTERFGNWDVMESYCSNEWVRKMSIQYNQIIVDLSIRQNKHETKFVPEIQIITTYISTERCAVSIVLASNGTSRPIHR